MNRNRLLLCPLFLGVALLVYSWYASYPVSIDSVSDLAFNHFPTLYWFSLALILSSLFLIGVTSKTKRARWIILLCLFMTMYSSNFFYYTLPTSDSPYFRGLSEYYNNANSLGSLKPSQRYLELPFFFETNKIAAILSGMNLQYLWFIFYAVIGLLLVTALYAYLSRNNEESSFFAATGFFILAFFWLDYQWVPFTLAFTFLLVALTLEARPFEGRGKTVAVLVLFCGMSFTHAFIPLFFILFELVYYVFSRARRNLRIIAMCMVVYFAVQIYQAQLSFADYIRSILATPSEYGKIAETTFLPALNPLDVVAQAFSRVVFGLTLVVFGLAFVFLLWRRKAWILDKVVFVTGITYSVAGIFTQLLGSRAIPLALIPVCSLGAFYLINRFRPYLKFFLLAVMIVFPFLPLHSSFDDYQILFQTKEAYVAENFMISYYNWNSTDLILAHYRVSTYLGARQPSLTPFETDSSSMFPRLDNYSAIVYTVGLGKSLLKHNITIEDLISQYRFNMVYDNGFSRITTVHEGSAAAS